MDTSVRDHLIYMRMRGLAPATIRDRRRVLRDLAAFAGRPLTRLKADDLRAWRQSLRATPGSVITTVSHARAFYGWALDVGRIRVNPAARLPVPRRARRLPRPVSEPDIAVALRHAPADIRLMIILAGWLGLRCCEIASLRWESVSLHARLMIVIGKRGKERALPLSDWLVSELHRYGVQRSGWVFLRCDCAGPRTAGRTGQMINQYLHSLDIDATAHQWRHRFATQLLDSCGNLRTVQEALGHELPETTAIYTLVSPRSLAAAMAVLPVPDELPEAALCPRTPPSASIASTGRIACSAVRCSRSMARYAMAAA